jgi:formamidopyrimidine-DNA glycosylase
MPELPEVETIKNDLAPRVIGKIITAVTIPSDATLRIVRRFHSAHDFIEELKGTKIQSVTRRAKYLIFNLIPEKNLIMHLGMSGQVLLEKSGSPYQPYTRAVFHLNEGTELRFIDPRKFGEVFLKPSSNQSHPLTVDCLGPEPLGKNFSVTCLTRILQNSRRAIKTLLLDQKKIAGIGNIYSDEILFQTKIHPTRLANTLGSVEIKLLHRSIRKILQDAIDNRGTTAVDKRYLDGLGNTGRFQKKLKVYQRQGNPCFACGTMIKSMRIGGRSASFCPQCQQ